VIDKMEKRLRERMERDLAELKIKNTITVEELKKRYENGERDFSCIVLTNADLPNLQLKGIILRNANLSYCDLSCIDLENADISNADLTWSSLRLANLRNAVLKNAKLRWILFDTTNLDSADLTKTDLGWARIDNTNLTTANLSEAILDWTSLNSVRSDVRQLSKTNFSTIEMNHVEGREGIEIRVVEKTESRAVYSRTLEIVGLRNGYEGPKTCGSEINVTGMIGYKSRGMGGYSATSSYERISRGSYK
jgi:hypothetical protein